MTVMWNNTEQRRERKRRREDTHRSMHSQLPGTLAWACPTAQDSEHSFHPDTLLLKSFNTTADISGYLHI